MLTCCIFSKSRQGLWAIRCCVLLFCLYLFLGEMVLLVLLELALAPILTLAGASNAPAP